MKNSWAFPNLFLITVPHFENMRIWNVSRPLLSSLPWWWHTMTCERGLSIEPWMRQRADNESLFFHSRLAVSLTAVPCRAVPSRAEPCWWVKYRRMSKRYSIFSFSLEWSRWPASPTDTLTSCTYVSYRRVFKPPWVIIASENTFNRCYVQLNFCELRTLCNEIKDHTQRFNKRGEIISEEILSQNLDTAARCVAYSLPMGSFSDFAWTVFVRTSETRDSSYRELLPWNFSHGKLNLNLYFSDFYFLCYAGNTSSRCVTWNLSS